MMSQLIMNSVWIGIWKETAAAYFKVLPCNSAEQTEETMENFSHYTR